MPRHAVYLWTLPMFHCNGWCFPWTMAANAGTNVCLRKVEAKAVFDAIREHKVTHYCGAPIVHGMLINAPEALRAAASTHKVSALVGGAAPPARDDRGHGAHGLRPHARLRADRDRTARPRCARSTTSGRALDIGARAERNGRQGVRYLLQEGMTVMDPETMQPRARRRRDDGRDHVPRQHHDEGLPEEPARPPTRRSPAAGSTRAISR